MDLINIKELEFDKMKLKPQQGTQSLVYDAGDICIKIFNSLSDEERKKTMKKLQEMDGITIDGVLFPLDLIVENGLLKGYTMHNFKNSINMFDFYGSVKKVNCKNIFNAIKKASEIVRKLHDNNIIVQDLSFDNILVNKDENIVFTDIDSCRYKDYSSPYYSLLLYEYTNGFQNCNFPSSKEVDKLSLILATFQIIFINEIQRVTSRQYNHLSKKLNTLNNMRPYTNLEISSINDLPYVDSLLDTNDDYVLNRIKQMPIKQRIAYHVYK